MTRDIIPQPRPVPVVLAAYADHVTYGTTPPRWLFDHGYIEGMSLDAPDAIPAGSMTEWLNMPLITVFERD